MKPDGNGISDTGNYANCPVGITVADYGVDIPAGSGNVTGTAWSKNIGWIDFAPAGPYPSVATGDDYAFAAQRVGNELRGWARIVGIQTEFEAVPSNSGGWQGWIRLHSDSNDPVPYGLDITKMDGTGNNKTYAWSDELGWIDFSKAKIVTPTTLKLCPSSCTSGSAPVSNSSTISMNPGDVKSYQACWNTSSGCDTNGDVTLSASWDETNLPDNAAQWGSPVTSPQSLTANGVAILSTEEMSVSYESQSINLTVAVIPTVSCYECNTTTFNCDGPSTFPGPSCVAFGKYVGDPTGYAACDAACNAPSSGTNWKEVAP